MPIAADLRPLATPIDDLNLLEGNPKRGDVPAIARSLDRFEQRKPIVVNRATREVIAGNHTLQAAIDLGWDEIAVVWVDDDPATAKAYALADNRTAELGTYDEVALAEMIADVRQADAQLLGSTGWDPGAIAEILSNLDKRAEGRTAADSLPEHTDEEPTTKEGDIWILGDHEHVVVCGDATQADVVRSAVAQYPEGQIDCIWTDPPYGIGYVEGKEHRPDAVGIRVNVAGDTLDNLELEELLTQVLGEAVAYMPNGAPFYMTAHKPIVFAKAAINAGLDPRHELVWVKGIFTMGRADYQYSHEKIVAGELAAPDPQDALGIMYGWVPGGAHPWYGGRTRTSVFQIPKPSRNELHPTQKPVELIEMMLANSTVQTGVVHDPFAGSGSTLIAAARLGRKSIMIERDPGYVDTIVQRWKDWSGEGAEKA